MFTTPDGRSVHNFVADTFNFVADMVDVVASVYGAKVTLTALFVQLWRRSLNDGQNIMSRL